MRATCTDSEVRSVCICALPELPGNSTFAISRVPQERSAKFSKEIQILRKVETPSGKPWPLKYERFKIGSHYVTEQFNFISFVFYTFSLSFAPIMWEGCLDESEMLCKILWRTYKRMRISSDVPGQVLILTTFLFRTIIWFLERRLRQTVWWAFPGMPQTCTYFYDSQLSSFDSLLLLRLL